MPVVLVPVTLIAASSGEVSIQGMTVFLSGSLASGGRETKTVCPGPAAAIMRAARLTAVSDNCGPEQRSAAAST